MNSIQFHRWLARGAFLAFLVAGVVVAGIAYRWIRGYAPPPDTDVFGLARGTWAWPPADTNCATDPHMIDFDADRTEMVITHAKPFQRADGAWDSVTHYTILEAARGRIRGAIVGETRLTDDGKPVVWDLVLRSPDRYAWHRTDWPAYGFTAEIRRCPAADAPDQ